MDRRDQVVVVGGSLAGLRTAMALRREGHEGPLTIVGDESHWPPFDRPPLSKQVLVGSLEPDRVRLRVPDDLDIEVRTGCRATRLDVEGRTVVLGDGSRLAYGAAVIATGATPRRIPGTDRLTGVHVLRSIDDSLALRAELEDARRVVVVGAGFIGCEVASSCRSLGHAVTLVDRLPLPLAPFGPTAGEIIAEMHRSNGVDVRLDIGVAGLDQDDRGHVQAVRLDDGSIVEADVVVVGIGVVPSTAWLEGSGLMLRDGVSCDDACLAHGSNGTVAAVGDVARWDHPRYGSVRIEHWTNAGEQAAHVAKVLIHGPEAVGPFGPVPYFWSDQFGCKLQFVGACGDGDEFQVVEGTVDDDRWVAAYGRDGVTVAALCVGWPARLAPWQALVAQDDVPFPPPPP